MKDNEKTTTALTVLDKNKFELVPFTEDMKEAIAEELDGIDNLRFDMVKTPTAGGLAFEIPGDDPENPDIAKEIVGIIVHHHKVKARPASNQRPGAYMTARIVRGTPSDLIRTPEEKRAKIWSTSIF